MKKLKKAFKAITAILKNPWLLNHVLNDDSIWEQHLLKKHDLKNGFPLLDINEICPNFNETLNTFTFLGGGSLPTDIGLLKALSRRFNDCSYFEIGTWRGESVANVAEVAKECYTLNLSNEDMHAFGMNEDYTSLIGVLSKEKENITHLRGDSTTFDYKGLNKKFDLIFIDGSHHYDFVKNDTEKVFKYLTHDNSIIVWHDYAKTPENLRPEVIAGICDGTPTNYRNNLYHVSNTMCAVFVRGDFKTTSLKTPVKPENLFKVSIQNRSV